MRRTREEAAGTRRRGRHRVLLRQETLPFVTAPSPFGRGQHKRRRTFEWVSDCLVCQATCHGRLSLTMALRMVRSFRATAMSATILGFPAAISRSKKAFKTGLCRIATIAPMNSAVRTDARPPPMKLLPFHWPDWRVKGARPASAAICLRLERAKFRQVGDERARDDRPNAGHGGQQVLLLAPGRRTAHAIADLGVEFGEFLLQHADHPPDALAQARHGDSLLALAFGPDHLDDLPPSGDEIGKQSCRFVRQRRAARAWLPRQSGRSPLHRSDRSWRVAPPPWRRPESGPD